MKNLTFFALLFVVSTTTFAQIKLAGETKIGNELPGNDPNNEVNVEVFGPDTRSNRPGGKISIGDYGSSANGSAYVFIAEAWNWDSDQMQIQGKNGIYLTVGGTSNIVAAELQTNGNLYIMGDYYSRGSMISSDINLKSNIKNMNGALASVMKLQGLTYDFKPIREDSVLLQLNSIVTSNEKDAKDLEKMKKEYENKKLENANQLGFSAQEVQKIFPQLVKKDGKGYLAVNYTAIVPVLVEAIKEQQTVIDEKQKKIDDLQKDIIAIKKKIGMQ
jgi:hypothetical protein